MRVSRTIRVVIASLLSLAVFASPLADERAQAIGTADNWSPTVEMRTPDGWFAQPVHGTLMPNGQVHFFGIQRSNWPPSPDDLVEGHAFLFDPDPLGSGLPASIVTNDLTPPVEIDSINVDGIIITDDLICAGHTLTADGQVFTTGGTREYTAEGLFVYRGIPTTTLFDGTTWTRSADMVETGTLDQAYRWYPTATRLPDKRILITGGFEQVTPNPAVNASTEVWDPVTGLTSVASAYSQTPLEIWQSDYTHVWVLPYPDAFYDILMIGERGVPIMNATDSLASWEIRTSEARPGATGVDSVNNGTSSVMLPIRLQNGEWNYANGSIINVAGTMGTTYLDQADVYDPVLRQWTGPIDLGTPRHHPSTIVLPDGRVVILAGHNVMGDDGVLQAQYIDPANDFAVSQGDSAAQQVRGYHSVSLLMPDGRILMAGGRDSVTGESDEKPTYQYYEPDYITADRPDLRWVDATELDYDSTFGAWVGGPEPVEAVLISLGSMTHSIDMNQRYVELGTEYFEGPDGTHILRITTPPDANTAPPGHYMLFVLDENRVPSEAKIVHID